MKSPHSMHYWVIFSAFSAGMIGILCGVGGDDPSRISLAGKVLLDGKPLGNGMIRFYLTSYADQPHVDVSVIENGGYAIPNSTSLIPGTYEVRICSAAQERSSRRFRRARSESQPLKADAEHVPARYNESSVLEVRIQRGGLSKFDFDLKR